MIHSVKLINCQSWADGLIPLAQDRINVLRADNNSGKSVLFKMLKITACPGYFTPKERKKLIRNGCDSANILYAFTDGSIGICAVYPTRVMYLYATDGKNFEKYEEPPHEMITKLGIIHNSDKFVANIIDMDQSLLLVDSNVHENYELIKLLTEDESLNELKTKIQLNLEDFKVKESDLRFQSLDIESLLENTEYKDVNKIKARINRTELLMELMETLDQIDTLYGKIQNNWVEHLDYPKLLKQLELLKVLANAITLAKSITFREKVKQEQIKTMDWAIAYGNALAKFKPVQQVDYGKLTQEIDCMKFLKDYSTALKQLKVVDKTNLQMASKNYQTLKIVGELFDKIQKIITIEDDFSKVKFEVKALELLQQYLKDLDKLKIVNRLDKTESELDTLELLSTLVKKFNCIVNGNETIRNLDKEIKELQNTITEQGTILECPHFGKVLYNGQECFHGVLSNEEVNRNETSLSDCN